VSSYHQNQGDQIVRQTRNRYRLLALLSIYPIYKAFDAYSKGDTLLGTIMAILGGIYLIFILYIFSNKSPG
jgi:hypothetical protein